MVVPLRQQHRSMGSFAMTVSLFLLVSASRSAANAPPVDLAVGEVTTSAPPAPSFSAEEGDLRIVGQVEVNGYITGALQVFLNGAFGAVCTTGFDPLDANVACRQMGFIGGTAIPTAIDRRQSEQEQAQQFQDFLAPMVLENLNCTGSEERLLECPGVMEGFETIYSDYSVTDIRLGFTYYGEFSMYCDPLRGTFAMVACGTSTGPAEGDLRLTGGGMADLERGRAEYGRLEVFSGGGWGSICDAELMEDVSDFVDVFDARFTDAAVSVACRQLGYAAGEKALLAQDLRPVEVRRIPIVLPGGDCSGEESSLLECSGVDLTAARNQCGLRDALAVTCFESLDPAAEGLLRLMGGKQEPGFEYGRLEIQRRGIWSTICDTESFTPDSAQVACSILGYDGGASLNFKQAFQQLSLMRGPNLENQVLVAALPVALASVDCDGNETSLLECTSSQEELRNCKLPDSNLTDATVLACANAATDCTSKPTAAEGELRLRGGFGSLCDPVHSGFVEVFHLGEWGAICTNNFAQVHDRLAADVVCRQLGFPHGTTVDPSTNPPNFIPGQDSFYTSYDPDIEEAEERQDRFWLNQVSCRGPEERLVDCDIGPGFRQNNANCLPADQRLTVVCRTFAVSEALEEVSTPGAEEGDVRLVEQIAVANWQLGRLEIFFDGSWSQVCSTKFGPADARVACRQLGLGAGTVASNLFPVEGRTAVLVHPEVAVTVSGCTGREATLLDCSLSDDGLPYDESPGCFADTGPGLILACVDPSIPLQGSETVAEGSVRLTDGGSGNGDGVAGGILEVFHAGAWGTVCAANSGLDSQNTFRTQRLSAAAATVACRELGFALGESRNVVPSRIPGSIILSPPWLTARLSCDSTEERVSACTALNFGSTVSCGATQRLICSNSTSGSGQVRLVGGAADPAGTWEYGRVQVFDGTFFLRVVDDGSFEQFGRRDAQVACRSLGFASGAQMMSGVFSGLPGKDNVIGASKQFACNGDEDSLADCGGEATFFQDYGDAAEGSEAVALICSTPTGCDAEEPPPSQGAIRLVSFQGVNLTTRPCDDVHYGGVEFFNEGQWGRVCGMTDLDPAAASVDALVICRQLGFPFGGLMDVRSTLREDRDYDSEVDEPAIVWATDVQCTGTESRLDECFFPEDFEGFSRFVSFPVPPLDSSRAGLRGFTCAFREFLGVVCRRFEIEESEVIR
eukprot:jgi/Ulvmu1/2838/UM144_0002.1